MPNRKDRPSVERGGPQSTRRRHVGAKVKGTVAPSSGDVENPPQKILFECSLGHMGDAAPRPHGGYNVGSFATSCPGGRECLAHVAEMAGCRPSDLIEDAPHYLEDVAQRGRRSTRPDPMPTMDDVRSWHRRMMDSPRCRRYLRERGLTKHALVSNRIGYDGRAFTFPVFDHRGVIVNLKRRYWPDPWQPGISKRSLKGHPSVLYPNLPAGVTALLVAGEIDALLARQNGFPAAVTTTSGASLAEHLAPLFARRYVAVAYDTGEEAKARMTVERLLRHGAREAWVVPLGLPEKRDDVADWFAKYRKTEDRLRELIRESRPRREHGRRG